ncbi:hypothetical protein LN040_09895 [Desulfovibrio subterraneus]|uniref:hypothetical protein n=1 Tax=Desulfovibrio subterraneus TaxID=2718620 RepID=UPI0022B93BDC|nr:hypothetical protein [Desulfovibrio subterraneus]WBF66044.1 hypothetical protein LN040_09895 [Desulfovibrio subterraneus]
MSDVSKIFRYIFYAAFVFFIFRLVESVHIYGLIPGKDASDPAVGVASSFSIYRDFVTLITGLLTLIIGAIGAGAYFSYQKINKIVEDTTKNINVEAAKIDGQRKTLEMFLKIEEGRNISDQDGGYSAAIAVYNDAESQYKNHEILYILRGEAYYYRNTTGDISNAICDFKRAIELKSNSARAWFGLGRAEYRSIQNKQKCINDEARSIKGMLPSDLVIFRKCVLSDDKVSILKAMESVERAISFQCAEAPARLELGNMQRSIGDDYGALKQYKLAYKSNEKHAACGFTYALHWLIVNRDCFDKAEEEGVVNILKTSSGYDVFNSKAAYALLWYYYGKIGKDEESDAAWQRTDQMVIDELFTSRYAEGSSCSLSME